MKKRYQHRQNAQRIQQQIIIPSKEDYKIYKQLPSNYLHQQNIYQGVFNSQDIKRHVNIRVKGLLDNKSKKKSEARSQYINNGSFYVDRFFSKLHVKHEDQSWFLNQQKFLEKIISNNKQEGKKNQRKQKNSESINERLQKQLKIKPVKKLIQNKNRTKIFVSPVKRLQNQLAQYIKNQFLHVQKMKPIVIKQQLQKRKQQIPKSITQIYRNRRTQIKFQEINYDGLGQRINTSRPYTQQKTFSTHQNQYIYAKKFKKDPFVFGLNNRVISQDKVKLYRDFLWKINFSNGIFVVPHQDLIKHFKVFVGGGNNSMLIRSLFKKRFWWIIVDKVADDTNFIWTQLKNNDFLKSQRSFNRKSNNLMTSSTASQIQNSKKQSDEECYTIDYKQYKDNYINIFSNYDLKLWYSYYLQNKNLQQKFNEKVYQKRLQLLKSKNAVRVSSVQNVKVHNHFIQNYFIGNKKALFYSMRKFYQLNDQNVFQYLPLTFHVSGGFEDPQFQRFFKIYNQFNQIKNADKDKNFKNIWIVKPGQFTNRGKGITVCSNLDSIKNRIRTKQSNKNGKNRTFIIQKYIQRPFLYSKRKFDIRHYMMITCINSQFKGYWYEDGYIRTTSYEYNINNCKDNLIHLTNDAIQKNANQYGRYEKGNKISYSQFQKYLDNYYKTSKYDFYKTILPKMKKITTDAIKAGYFLLDQDKRQHNFQIFGLDFMIDQDFKPWLIEINTNPCLQLSSPLLSKIIPAMVQNALKIGLDPLFQPPYNWPTSKKYDLGQNPLQNNKFILVFDQSQQGQQIQQLYKNVDKIDKNMGQIQQQNEQYEDEGKQLQQL